MPEQKESRYFTSDIFEAATLIVYSQKLEGILVDKSKEKSEAIFEFHDVGGLPFEYRAGTALVDPHNFKKIMIDLKKQMFKELDN